MQFDSILAIMDYPSYIMLIDPASNVSVPLTVVIRTRSRVPPSAILPPPVAEYESFVKPITEA